MPVRMQVLGSDSLRRKLDGIEAAVRGRALERAVVAGALVVQNAAKGNAPYRTGNLRRSIHIGGHADLAPERSGIQDKTGAELPRPEIADDMVAVYIGTDVEYARRIEYGFNDVDSLGRQYNQAAHPFLRPAIDENQAAVRTEVGEALRDLIQAAIR